MSKILALFRSFSDADIDFASMQLKDDLHLIDACQIGIKDNHKIKFENLNLHAHERASDGLLLPALVGLLFFHPVHRMAERVENTLDSLRLDQNFVKFLRTETQAGDSILFLMVEDEDELRIGLLLKRLISEQGGRLVQTDLSQDCEQMLRKLFTGQALDKMTEPCETNY